jgi:hypothetical protein
MIKNSPVFLLILIILSGAVFCFDDVLAQADGMSVTITIIQPICGNDVAEPTEQCDGSDLAGQTCVSLGYAGEPLGCNFDCTFATSSCTTAVTSSPSGGGGGGGGYITPSVVTQVIFEGRAYPLSKVVVLKDGQIAVSTIAGPDANFYVSLTGLSSGNYIFAVYGEDNQERRSMLFTFPVFITQGAATKVSGIFIAPTIAVDKSEVKRGDNIAIFGQSVPNSEITISVNSDEEFFNKVNADANGVYLYNFDTSPLEMAQHFTKSKAALNGEISSFSKAIGFTVGTKNIEAVPETPTKSDLNNDKRVNLVDFSIAAYWYKRPSPPVAVDLNSDGKINLVDFSIMAYYWTG